MAKRVSSSSTTRPEPRANYLHHRDEEVMRALVSAGALVALADGRVEAVERDELVDHIDRQRLVPTMARYKIAKSFDAHVRQLKDRHSASVIVEAFRPVTGLSLASVVVHTAQRVAAADRQIHHRELEAIKLIRLILKSLPAGNPIVTPDLCSPSEYSSSATQASKDSYPNDWIVYAAFLPAILTLAAIGITAATGSWQTSLFRNSGDLSMTGGDADDYVEGLARLGIAKLPPSKPRRALEAAPSGDSER